LAAGQEPVDLGQEVPPGGIALGQLREIVEQSRARSAVYDVITNRVPVSIEVDTP